MACLLMRGDERMDSNVVVWNKVGVPPLSFASEDKTCSF
jgi:hypothetical protein